jgi:hypothetical protein
MTPFGMKIIAVVKGKGSVEREAEPDKERIITGVRCQVSGVRYKPEVSVFLKPATCHLTPVSFLGFSASFLRGMTVAEGDFDGARFSGVVYRLRIQQKPCRLFGRRKLIIEYASLALPVISC